MSQALLVLMAVLLAACGTTNELGAGGVYKVGKPYQIDGNWYYPQEDPRYDETGIASWYGREFAGRRTANGEVFDPRIGTAAHKTLPMPSNVRVTNLENGRSMVVRVNDRGPFKASRIIDMSEHAAELLGFKAKGMARVRVQFVGIAELPNGGRPGKRVAGVGRHEELGEPPPAAVTAPPPKRVAVPVAPPPLPQPRVTPTPEPGEPPVPVAAPVDQPTDEVIEVAVKSKTRIFVQAGSFLDRSNAERLTARLRAIAEFRISQRRQDGKLYYRVRAGPLKTVEKADAILARVLADGQQGASIVVE